MILFADDDHEGGVVTAADAFTLLSESEQRDLVRESLGVRQRSKEADPFVTLRTARVALNDLDEHISGLRLQIAERDRRINALEHRIAEMSGEVVGALGVESPGEYSAETWNEAMEAIQSMMAPRGRGLSARDYAKLAEWSRMVDRPDPNTHFTAGAVRDAANAFNEGIEAREVEA